ncbi:MAG TPA: carboxypeptidase regulatory-like domain-containing protein [Anaeromyxobacteraceae bacterium]|nr:carboxypeptidase regulatory-like domain-containing protein [Anaeromyxobacteraceae bacterium]
MMTATASLAQRLTLLAACLALVACGDGKAKDPAPPAPGTLQGVVRDIDTGAPLAGVVVSDGTGSATTGADGGYSLTRPAGAHTLTAAVAGYATTSRAVTLGAGEARTLAWSLTPSPGEYVDYTAVGYSGPTIPAYSLAMDYVVLAWNDLGMHCAQDDYSYFLILPPYNTLHVQVVKRGGGVVTSGITVSYAFPKKTDSTLHTNFWTYAGKYGFTLAPNEGLAGFGLSGTMDVDANGLGFVATGIPITPYDDDGTWDPFGTAVITVTDSNTKAVLQTAEVVAPISTELNCFNCHGADAFLDILRTHDRRSGTALAADRAKGALHMCAECHADPALAAPGKPGVTNLSRAMHGFHADKVSASATSGPAACYNCHPGPRTQCLRGQMAHAGLSCQDCHGDMAGMAAALRAGRQPWLEEPRCGACHGARYEENAGTLYRNSLFRNSPDMNVPGKMNGKLYCEACHNSTHGELRSTLPADGTIPQKFQGDGYWLWNCWLCHTDYMPSPSMHL